MIQVLTLQVREASQKFDKCGHIYGKSPNKFVLSQSVLLKEGKIINPKTYPWFTRGQMANTSKVNFLKNFIHNYIDLSDFHSKAPYRLKHLQWIILLVYVITIQEQQEEFNVDLGRTTTGTFYWD